MLLLLLLHDITFNVPAGRGSSATRTRILYPLLHRLRTTMQGAGTTMQGADPAGAPMSPAYPVSTLTQPRCATPTPDPPRGVYAELSGDDYLSALPRISEGVLDENDLHDRPASVPKVRPVKTKGSDGFETCAARAARARRTGCFPLILAGR